MSETKQSQPEDQADEGSNKLKIKEKTAKNIMAGVAGVIALTTAAGVGAILKESSDRDKAATAVVAPPSALANGKAATPITSAGQRATVNAHAEKAHEKLHIDASKSTFNRLREAGVFPEENKWAVTASSEAFHATAQEFAESEQGKKLLIKSEIDTLVPASGVLLSPLEMAFVLAEKSEKPGKFHYTFTEIDEKAYGKIDQHVKTLVDNTDNLSNFQVNTTESGDPKKPLNERSAKKRISFDYKTTQGRTATIAIDFEYKMSGKRYFRQQSMEASDIIMLHDTDFRPFGGKVDDEIALLFAQGGTSGIAKKPHYVVLPYRPDYTQDKIKIEVDRLRAVHPGKYQLYTQAADEMDKSIIFNDLPEGQKLQYPLDIKLYEGIGNSVGKPIIGHNYGCGENHQDDPERKNDAQEGLGKGAKIVEIDGKLLEELRILGGQRALTTYSELLMPGTDPNDDDILLNLHEFKAFALAIHNPEVKQRVYSALTRVIQANIDGLYSYIEEQKVKHAQKIVRNTDIIAACSESEEACVNKLNQLEGFEAMGEMNHYKYAGWKKYMEDLRKSIKHAQHEDFTSQEKSIEKLKKYLQIFKLD